jgi:hypothetical protein
MNIEDIVDIESIVDGLLDGHFTKQQAISLLSINARGTLSDKFAAAALCGCEVPRDDNALHCCEIAARCYHMADAMLAEREHRPKNRQTN